MKINQFLPIPQFTFVWITIGFAVGFTISEYILFRSVPFSILILPLVFFFLKTSIRNSVLGQLLLLMIFMGLGVDYGRERNVKLQLNNWENYYYKGRVYEAEIDEIAINDKEWKKCILNAKSIYTESQKIPQNIKILAYVKVESGVFERGDVLRLNAEVIPIKNGGNPGEFDAVKYWKSKNIHSMCFVNPEEVYRMNSGLSEIEKYLVWLDRALSEKLALYFSGQELGVIKALVLGDKDQLDTETTQSFSSAGAMHVLAVSGLHVGIVLNILLYLLGKLPRLLSKYQALFVALTFLILYAAITGFSPSVCRAVLMFGLLSMAKVFQRHSQPLNVLFFSAFLLLIYEPNYLFDIGFQLSYAAMIGIFLFYPIFSKLVFVKSNFGMKLIQATALGLSATISTFPLTLFYFHQFPNYFLISNLLLLFTAEFVLILGIAFLACGSIPGIKWLLG
ncbi:MAG: ComEC family competence protein, partial [Bacteroidetes bacterium]|nr:ComEC family competence protein [Bacteroidota bacterium]